VSAEIVLPRFLNLRADEIMEKSPGEIVTIADREAEIRLSEGLNVIDGDARIVGEEGCSADPSLLADLDRGRCWIIDPIDGTANFAAGREPFGIMIALVEDGVAQAGWLYDPVNNRMCHASRGRGAFINGVAITARPSNAEFPIVSIASQFMTEEGRAAVHARAERAFQVVPIPRCAAEHYPRICLGQNDMAMFQRTLPWDHIPGALFLTEAGGHVARWDGTPYRVGDDATGILAAASPALWDLGAEVLLRLPTLHKTLRSQAGSSGRFR
jgi:fructose-1,6-bisphosphatase/inositol monophosphatase family enzyme